MHRRHPASGYVQGINDLVTPFLAVFLGEHFADGGPAVPGGMDAWEVASLNEAVRPGSSTLEIPFSFSIEGPMVYHFDAASYLPATVSVMP